MRASPRAARVNLADAKGRNDIVVYTNYPRSGAPLSQPSITPAYHRVTGHI